MEKYHHWEIEELACVGNYLWSLFSDSFDRIEASFVGIRLPKPSLDDPQTNNRQSYTRSIALDEAKFTINSIYVDYLLSLSLPLRHHVLQLDRLAMQREISSHIYYDGQKRSLSSALKGFSKMIVREDVDTIRDYIYAFGRSHLFPFINNVERPNEGWLSVYSNAETISPHGLRRTAQSLGYVFWDSWRLRDMGFIGRSYDHRSCPMFKANDV